MSAIPIGIAVVELNGAYLIGRRVETGPLPGYDEFPGGKCLPGESSRDCAARECLEETGLKVIPVELLLERKHDYSHGRVRLSFWLCRPADANAGTIAPRDAYRWVPAAGLASLRFPEANAAVVELLTFRTE